ncbi:hypothetical protein EYV94_14015 [Puteibacter caeruleilacunae]|nr:hypothetical protein EYV94_14015 [Puteibacter caeruleilacunae]
MMTAKGIISSKRLIGFIVLFCSVTSVIAQSKAHKFSRFAIIDPTYSKVDPSPKMNINESATPWIYGASELECWRLQLLRKRTVDAKLKVNYPGVYHQPYTKGEFRLSLKNPQQLSSIKFRAVGDGKVIINGSYIASFSDQPDEQEIELEKDLMVQRIQFEIATKNDPVALIMYSKALSTSLNNWEWRSPDGEWEIAFKHPQNTADVPPHRLENPTTKLNALAVTNDVLFDFGRELLGYITVVGEDKPVINVGESEKEALDVDCNQKEQSLELVKQENGKWRTKNPVAFRYVYAEHNEISDVSCEAIYYPATYKGAFACSDSELTKIWMNSAYTLRLCMHDFLLDGIKRDRLPWTGDLAMSLLVNAYTFSEPELVRRSLVALGRAGIKERDINGIIDYSLWWIIAQDQYQLYYADSTHLQHEWERIKETLDCLSARCDSEGFLISNAGTWLFIDWVNQDKWTALQILWWWAQKSGAKLARRVGHDDLANDLERTSQSLKAKLKEVAWNKEEHVWLSKNDPISEITRHPNFLSIVSGLTDLDEAKGIKNMLEKDEIRPVGTPYMSGFEVMAVAQMGNIDYMLKHVSEYWGGMLNKGATTFWEAYNPHETYEQQYSFYERSYAKSLCHAWSSGPAALLPSELFGLKPVDDGWRRFSLQPNLGKLEWASACVPTIYGNVVVDIDGNNLKISIPKGTTLEWNNKSIEGPKVLREKLK